MRMFWVFLVNVSRLYLEQVLYLFKRRGKCDTFLVAAEGPSRLLQGSEHPTESTEV